LLSFVIRRPLAEFETLETDSLVPEPARAGEIDPQEAEPIHGAATVAARHTACKVHGIPKNAEMERSIQHSVTRSGAIDNIMGAAPGSDGEVRSH
jgi:hypothetical protein